MATQGQVFGAPQVSGATPLANTHILVGNASGIATDVAVTGDVTIANTGATTLAAGSASNLNSGTLPAGRMPALTGDVTTSAGAVATTVAKIAGTTVSGTTGTTNVVLSNSPTLVTPVLGVASATSISFGGTALSAYVEGSWTPAISTDGTVGTPAYSAQVGSYERIGRQVTARFRITLSGWTGSPTGNVAITGLPISSSATTNDFGSCFISLYVTAGLPALNYGITGAIIESSTTILLRPCGNTQTNTITAAQLGPTGQLTGVCFYRA